jgi:hypothetical protein
MSHETEDWEVDSGVTSTMWDWHLHYSTCPKNLYERQPDSIRFYTLYIAEMILWPQVSGRSLGRCVYACNVGLRYAFLCHDLSATETCPCISEGHDISLLSPPKCAQRSECDLTNVSHCCVQSKSSAIEHCMWCVWGESQANLICVPTKSWKSLY